MLVEKRARQQSLTLEETEVLFLANKLPKVLAMFQTDYNTDKRCFNCTNWQGDNKKYCPLKGNVGSDFYCKSYIQRSKSKTELVGSKKHTTDMKDGEHE